MSLAIGNFVIHGSERQNAQIAARAEHASGVLGTLIAPQIHVFFLPSDQMPLRPDGGPSVGYTPSRKRIDLWAQVAHYDCPDTFDHEVIHTVPFSAQQKADCCALATPAGGEWNPPGYEDDVRETVARCGSRAVLGVVNPPYKKFYTHDIDPSKDGALAEIILRPRVIAGPDEPDIIPPQPTPADPVALQAQIDDLSQMLQGRDIQLSVLEERLAAIAQDLDPITISLAAVRQKALA